MSAIFLSGHAEADAQARMRTDGVWFVSVRVALPAPNGAKAITVVAEQTLGSGVASAFAAANRAHHLRRGVRVQLYADAIRWQRGRARVEGNTRLLTPQMSTFTAAGPDR